MRGGGCKRVHMFRVASQLGLCRCQTCIPQPRVHLRPEARKMSPIDGLIVTKAGRGEYGRQQPEVENPSGSAASRLLSPASRFLPLLFSLNFLVTRIFMRRLCHSVSQIETKNPCASTTQRCVAQHRSVRESIRVELNLDIKERDSRLQALRLLPASRIFLPCRHRLTYILLLMRSLPV